MNISCSESQVILLLDRDLCSRDVPRLFSTFFTLPFDGMVSIVLFACRNKENEEYLRKSCSLRCHLQYFSIETLKLLLVSV